MPELFRQYGFIFMFFSREHEPIHMHVRGHNGDAKFNCNGEGFVIEYVHNIKAGDLKRIERMVAEPTRLQHFFLTHPEINVSGFAQKYGFNASLLRSYINGFKTPSPEREQEIMHCIEDLGNEYLSIAS